MITMTKSGKLLLGILTFVPLVCLIAYIGYCVYFFFEIFEFEHATSSRLLENGTFESRPEHIISQNLGVLFGLIISILLSSLGLLIYYIIHIMKNPKFRTNNIQQLVWALIVLFGGFIGGIVYFFMEIYPLPNKLSKPD